MPRLKRVVFLRASFSELIHEIHKYSYIIYLDFKSIVQPFELEGVISLIRSAVKNWRSSKLKKIFYDTVQSHERSIKPFSAAKGFLR
jgi:hypothetical protein